MVSCLDTSVNITEPDPDPEPQPGTETLVYFWFFGGEIANNVELVRVNATFPTNTEAHISYTSSLPGYPDTGRKGSMERRNAPTDINYRPQGNNGRPFQAEEMRAIQIRSPFTGPNGENTMIFHAPTDGFKDIKFALAAMDEGSAEALVFDYSVNGGSSWTTEGLAQPVQNLTTNEFNLFRLNFSGIEAANDNPNFKVRVRFEGSNLGDDNGTRVTFNNVSVDGVSLAASAATALKVADINDGETVYANQPFSVLIQSVGADGRPVEVTEDTPVTLTLGNGTGALSGTLSGVIAKDSESLRLEGVLYNTVENGVTLTAAAQGLSSGTSEAFNVNLKTYSVTLSLNTNGAGTLEGAGNFEEGAEVTITATPNPGFDFINWTVGETVFSSNPSHTFNMPAENLAIVANFSGEAASVTITRWTFEETLEPAQGQGVASLLGGTITHSTTVDSGWRITDFPEQFTGSGTAGAEFMVSTAGFNDVVVTFGHRASGTMSRWASFQYTTDGGTTWTELSKNDGALSPHDAVVDMTLDFSGISAASNNANFGIKVVSIFSPVEFNPEVPDEVFAANTAYHRARTQGTGGGVYSGGGNWRLLNVTFSGKTQ